MNIEIPHLHIQLGKQGWVMGNQVPEEALTGVTSEKNHSFLCCSFFLSARDRGINSPLTSLEKFC